MSFGWECDENVSRAILDRYAEAGGNLIDTADIYAGGDSEAIIGRWLKNRSRNDYFLATKVRFATGPGPDEVGLSRRHIIAAAEASLRRLQVESVDLYQVHCWDAATPLEETMETLDGLVRSGKVRAIGVSNFTGWQLQKAMDLSRFRGWEKFVSLQACYNLLDRFTEWDLLPVCRNEGLGLLCWSPLAGGWLTGLIRPGMTRPPSGSRIEEAEKGGWSESWSNYDSPHTWGALETFLSLAQELGKPPAQVALNWLRGRPGVTSCVLGANTLSQLEDNLQALDWTLEDPHRRLLDEAGRQDPPRYPYGFIRRFNKGKAL
jgi:aryl-alcohol dehydrogenase-like predicted oxidoreductase